MKKFIDEEKYTTREQSKILEPIMGRLRVKADGFWDDYDLFTWEDLADRFLPQESIDLMIASGIKAYRLDTLLWVLPDWRFKYKGKEAIAAAVELIKLLDDNNLLGVKEYQEYRVPAEFERVFSENIEHLTVDF